MADSARSKELRAKLNAIHAESVEMEMRAGIANDAERARESRVTHRPRLRDLYFSIPDPDLRKRLIAKERESERFTVQWWQEEVDAAARDVAHARAVGANWWVVASLGAVVGVGVGYSGFGLPGAIGGALVAYFWGRHLEQSGKVSRDRAVANAEIELKENQKILSEAMAEAEAFSQLEERTGQREQESRSSAKS